MTVSTTMRTALLGVVFLAAIIASKNDITTAIPVPNTEIVIVSHRAGIILPKYFTSGGNIRLTKSRICTGASETNSHIVCLPI